MHSQTAHLIIFTGYSDKQSNMTIQKSFTHGGEINHNSRRTQHLHQHFTLQLLPYMWEYYDAVNEQHSQQWFNKERERWSG